MPSSNSARVELTPGEEPNPLQPHISELVVSGIGFLLLAVLIYWLVRLLTRRG